MARQMKKFVALMISGLVPQMELLGSGGTYKEISKTSFSGLEIPLPPLEFQKEIVAENWKPRIKINPDWPMVKMGEVCREDKVPVDPNLKSAEKLPYLGMDDIESNTGNILQSRINTKVKSTTFAFNKKHILYGKLRPYLNKVALPEFSGRCTTEFIPLLPINVCRKFITYILREQNTIDYVMHNKSGARMPRVDRSKLLKYSIPHPPIETQKQIVAEIEKEQKMVEECKKLIAIHEQKIKDKIVEVWGE